MLDDNEKKLSAHANLALRVIVAGPEDWRGTVVSRIKADVRYMIVGEIESDINVVEITKVHQADILVITVDPEFVAPATKLAVALQKKIPALAVVMVLPPMYGDELMALDGYRSTWSMVAAETSEDTDKFLEALWSASRGMTWVDPAMYRRLNEVRAVNSRRSAPVADFDHQA